MQRIGTPSGLFDGGNPSTNTKGTVVTADWLNAIQEELAALVEDNGSLLNPDANDQLVLALSGRLLNIQKFLVTGAYTPTPGTKMVLVDVQGDGGGSSGLPASIASGAAWAPSGGAGAFARGLYRSGFSGVTVTVGQGGAAGASGGGLGSNGSGSSFGSLLICPGGNAGAAATSTTTYPNNSGFAASTADPSGSGIIYLSKGPQGSQVLMASNVYGTGFAQQSPSAMGLNYGAGAVGRYIGPSQVGVAGYPGMPGIVLVYEFR